MNTDYREVPDEVYKSLDAVGGDEKWWEAVELQKLILAHNDIESLKEDLKNLPLLVVLNVSHNKLSHLPAAIGEIHMLKSLDVSFNSIVEIPEEIGSAASLVKFDCSNNRLSSLPSSLGHCINLSELKASNNNISSLPEELGNCSKLTKFDIEGNKLEMLSNNFIASCTMLMELNASKNLLSSLPESIGGLSRLIRLDLHQNRISSIPSSIKGCSSLLEFYIGNNALSSLPAEIGSLTQLGTFDLQTNQVAVSKSRLKLTALKEYPVEACSLRLSVLDLSNNSLSGLPPEIDVMYSSVWRAMVVLWPTNVQEPNLVENVLHPLSSLQTSKCVISFHDEEGPVLDIMCLMTTLRKLLLTGNPLRTLRSSLVHGPTPALLRYLRSRLPTDEESAATTAVKEDAITMAARSSLTSKELSLAGLSLGAVPSEIWKSSDITKVNLSGNSIEELPSELRSCVSLEALILSKNKIKEWPAAVLASLPKLVCLKLDGNPLRKARICHEAKGRSHHIPSDGFRAASKLQILDLSGAAGSLPENPAFSSLPELQELYLSSLQLRNIEAIKINAEGGPEDPIGLLEPNLQVLKLEGNPMRSIRRPILDRGTKAILKYLKEKIVEQ
ncbi:hypothetical protein DH2020_008581 [Rehmannia glutinosa]|uniref:Disease resistance R13L4/SHOC-2-like LRR domain-containing protein n=1 Tax=Rehmannia glutinosa TaxID=99300 RepID=A0ABR0X3T8_REHGL